MSDSMDDVCAVCGRFIIDCGSLRCFEKESLVTNPKDVMKKAEELEMRSQLAIEMDTALDSLIPKWNSSVHRDVFAGIYKAGYTAALQTKTDKVQILIEALKSEFFIY